LNHFLSIRSLAADAATAVDVTEELVIQSGDVVDACPFVQPVAVLALQNWGATLQILVVF